MLGKVKSFCLFFFFVGVCEEKNSENVSNVLLDALLLVEVEWMLAVELA